MGKNLSSLIGARARLSATTRICRDRTNRADTDNSKGPSIDHRWQSSFDYGVLRHTSYLPLWVGSQSSDAWVRGGERWQASAGQRLGSEQNVHLFLSGSANIGKTTRVQCLRATWDGDAQPVTALPISLHAC